MRWRAFMSAIARPMARLETPVVFFIWRRPELTRRVFARIAATRPKCLIIVADGAIDGDADTERRCAAARDVVERIDWACEVHRDYASQHLGLRTRLETGLDFAFSIANSAIIIEDDCLPEQTFFHYAQDLLRFYEDDEQIGCISGYKPPDISIQGSSYAFTRYPLIWGWATWRRVWMAHDRAMHSWPQAKQNNLMLSIMRSANAADFWTAWFDQQYSERPNLYAVRFMYSCFASNLYSIVPSVNLISNLGYGIDATHTVELDSPHANAPTGTMTWPLIHPAVRDRVPVDRQIERTIFSHDPNAYCS